MAKARSRRRRRRPRLPRPQGGEAGSKRAEIQAAAERGEMPTPPGLLGRHAQAVPARRWRSWSRRPTPATSRRLKADKTEPKSSSRQAICRYRDLAITALEAAQAKLAKAA
jgi:hypothetical protein